LKRFFIRLCKLFLSCFLLLLVLIGVQVFRGWHCELQGQLQLPVARSSERVSATSSIPEYARPEDDAFIGYPEWYIVWSYVEKADFQETSLPSGFPYFAAIRQYWGSYCCVARLVRGKYSYNGGGHLMLIVIGTSFSGEYILKGLYEKSIGRFSEWTSGHQPVEEDKFAYKVAREYADFVHIRPFYEFHFAHQARALWSDTPFWGRHLFRKWERKTFLTIDYLFEGAYSWLVEKASHISYGTEPSTTYAWITSANLPVFQQLPHLKIVQETASTNYIVAIPRYQEFTDVAAVFAQHDVHFVEIAGNTQISVSVIAPQSWRYPYSDATTLFSAPVLIRPGSNRILLVSPVSSLHTFLNALRAENVPVEHIYDY
jgi:hypothetical protein